MNLPANVLQRISIFLTNDSSVLAAVIVGSQARGECVADEYSDIDIIIIVKNPEQYLLSDDWLREIGTFHISFIEPTFFDAKERRILFDDGVDTDFIIISEDQSRAIQNGEAVEIFARGYKVIKDKIGISAGIEDATKNTKISSLPNLSENEFHNLINDFWFHSVWTAKKTSRGELFTAKSCLDIYMKRLLLTMIENYTRLSGNNDVWYNGRFIEKWADKWILEGLAVAYANYNRSDIISALFSSMNIFKDVSLQVAQKQSFLYPKDVEAHAYKIVNQVIQYNKGT